MSITTGLNNPVRIENWSVTYSGGPFTAPELIQPCLVGEVYEHPHFSQGHRIKSSGILKTEGRFIQTHHHTYILGEPSDDYIQWCKENSITIDKDWPIKLLKKETANG